MMPLSQALATASCRCMLGYENGMAFKRGLTAKKIACKYNISYYNVLKTINVIRKLTNHKAYSAEVASATKAGHKTTVRNY